jgi:hypothetical protein
MVGITVLAISHYQSVCVCMLDARRLFRYGPVRTGTFGNVDLFTFAAKLCLLCHGLAVAKRHATTDHGGTVLGLDARGW